MSTMGDLVAIVGVSLAKLHRSKPRRKSGQESRTFKRKNEVVIKFTKPFV